MNCVEFRRQLAIDPQANAADFVQHRAECPRCAEAHARALIFESHFARVLNVAAPAQLAETILLAQSTAERHRRAGLRRISMFAAAAALVLAVGIVGMRVEAKPLSVQAVEHLRSEEEVLALTKPVAADKVIETFARRGVRLKRVPEDISFVAPCPVGQHRSVHLVMPTGAGPVTVIYVADQGTGKAEDFERDGLRGRIVPLGSGTLILLAKNTTEFDRIAVLWRDAIAG
jgi:hypothetical protein